MSGNDSFDIQRVARLSRLVLDSSETNKIEKNFNTVLGFINTVTQTVADDTFSPLCPADTLRDDIPSPGICDPLSLLPYSDCDGYVSVPRAFGKDD